jgi:hypothetical protein
VHDPNIRDKLESSFEATTAAQLGHMADSAVQSRERPSTVNSFEECCPARVGKTPCFHRPQNRFAKAYAGKWRLQALLF